MIPQYLFFLFYETYCSYSSWNRVAWNTNSVALVYVERIFYSLVNMSQGHFFFTWIENRGREMELREFAKKRRQDQIPKKGHQMKRSLSLAMTSKMMKTSVKSQMRKLMHATP